MFNGYKLFCLELKSTKGTSFTFSLEDNDHMIKKTQIESLIEVSKYKNTVQGFIFNFRKYEETYYLDISGFNDFLKETDKKSINLEDVKKHGGVLIPQKKKRVRYLYDLSYILKDG